MTQKKNLNFEILTFEPFNGFDNEISADPRRGGKVINKLGRTWLTMNLIKIFYGFLCDLFYNNILAIR